MNDRNKLVLANIISGVETGGQRYGYGRWDDYTPPYKNTSGEHTCTLGAYQFYGSEANQLCNLIFKEDKELFRKLDKCSPTIESMLSKDWVAMRWNPSSSQAAVLSSIISTETGIACQKKLFFELQLDAYVAKAVEFGVKDVKAQMMWVEIQHLGGGNAPKRVFTRANGNYSVDNLLNCVHPKYADYTKYSNPVESQLFWTRHVCCATWIKDYAVDESAAEPTIFLSVGDTGEKVKTLQENLMLIGLADCTYYGTPSRFVDGDFGDITKKSVIALQKICDLEQDGIYAEKTDAALQKLVKEAKASKFDMTVAEFLKVMKSTVDSVREWTYGNAAFLPVYKLEKYTSCDRYVDSVLWNAGLKDIGNRAVGHLEAYLADLEGCKKITNKEDVSAGDIVFFKGHVFMVGNAKGNGKYERYDCGSTDRIKSVQPSIEGIDGFIYAYRLPFKPEQKKEDTSSVGTRLVKCGQTHLNNYCGAGLGVDGEYGKLTRKAFIRAIQTALNKDYNCGLNITGEWDTKIELALRAHYVTADTTKKNIVTVLAIGLYINQIEPYGLVMSGKLIEAVKKYQKKYSLDVDGVAGVNTFKSLATMK